MRRVCAALGTWQLVMLAAALRQEARERGREGPDGGDVLLLYGRAALTPRLRELMPVMAAATWPWERVAWADDLIDSPLPGPAEGLRRLGRALRDRVGIGGDRVDELWLSKLWDLPEKRLCEALPEASIRCFEDGLQDYMPRPIEPWYRPYLRRDPRWLARAAWHRVDGRYRVSAARRFGVVDAGHARRAVRAYLSIAEQVPPPPFLAGLPISIIGHDLLRRAVSDASAALGPWGGAAASGRPAVVVLGQCFWRWRGMGRDEEIRAYRDAVRAVVDRGYRVLWKDHPRADPPLAPEVGEGLPPEVFGGLELPQACPVELALGRLGPVAIASASSSALFYAPKVAGVRPYQIRGPFAGLGGEFAEMVRLTARHVEPIEALPAVGPPPAAPASAPGPARARRPRGGPPPAVSVLMPAYNAERYVEEAVESVLGQTFADFEFLIVDDGSTDRTRPILERLAARDPRIRLVSRPNTGYVVALNEMIGMARAPLLARMDADDVALPRRFERQVAYLEAHPDCLAVGSAVEVVDSDGDPLCVWNADVSSHEQIDAQHLDGRRGAVLCHPSTMMRAEAVRAAGGYRVELEPAEDLDLYLRLAERGRLANLTEPLLRYRMVPSSASHARKREQVVGLRRAIAEAYVRRGLPPGPLPPLPSESAGADLTDLSHNRRLWGWWALRAGHVRTARKHARASLARSPWSSRSWRLMLCAIRGR